MASFGESLKDIVTAARDAAAQVWDGAKPAFDHGRTEAASLLMTGSAHVMNDVHMRGQQQEQETMSLADLKAEAKEISSGQAPDHGLTQEASKQQEQDRDRGMER